MRRTLLTGIILISLAIYSCSRTDDSTSTNLQQPRITGVSPATVNPGQTDIEGRIHGSNFVSLMSISLGDGVNVESFQALSETEIYIFFSVQHDAAPGPRNVIVATTSGAGNLNNGISIGNNRYPEAKFTVSPFRTYKGDEVRFDGSKSTDDKGIAQYKWQFGDGKQDSGKVVNHTYTRAGNFRATLIVSDSENLSSEAWQFLDVDASQAPIVQFTVSPSQGDINTLFQFDASGSRDPDGRIKSYVWAFGDGTTGTGMIVNHKFKFAGTHPVTLNVIDNSGVRSFGTRLANVTGGPGPSPGPIPGGGGTLCTVPVSKRSPDLYGTVASADNASKTIVIQLYNSASCANVFYRCGDVKLGGDGIGGKEIWYGQICSISDLGNNNFQVRLGGGKGFPNVGQQNVYLHWQHCGSADFCN
ncbi:PKD domain-containing protein [bacterium]|nr:PKD domain-containing protein [bacterium]MCI0602420.1 PKD domain-containing protein [bacterium]